MDDYPDLLKEYLDFCSMREKASNTKKLDLSEVTWISPTKLLLIQEFLKNNQKIEIIYPKIGEVSKYLNFMLTEGGGSQKRTYLPLAKLPEKRNEANPIIERLQHLCKDGKNLGGLMAFGYFLGEMVDNVYDHSQFLHAYVFAQMYPKKKFSEISLIDDGISIQGSYKKVGYTFSSAEALLKAIEGLSAKDKERGFGLRTNVRLFTEGLKGEFLIVSGGAALYVGNNDQKVFKLELPQHLQGTLICVRLPYPAKEVNIYDYIS